MSSQDSESGQILEDIQMEEAILNNFPFNSSNCSDKTLQENDQNHEDENAHFKSTNTFTSKSVNAQNLDIMTQETKSINCVELKNEQKNDNISERPKKLNKKRKNSSHSKSKKNKKLNNWRKAIARNFFNKHLKNIIKKMATSCKLVISFESFPDKFIFNVIKTNNIAILKMTFEELINNEKLYKEIKSKAHYFKNKLILGKIKSNMHLVNKEKLDIEQILNLNFKDLYKNYLQSEEYKQKKIKLFTKKGISEVKVFEEMSENFIECYKF